MIHYLRNRLALIAGLAGVLLGLVFAVTLFRMSGELRIQVRERMIERAAVLLQPVAQRQFEQRRSEVPDQTERMQLVSALLGHVNQEGLLALAIFDAEGNTLQAIPTGPLFVDLPVQDLITLTNGTCISRHEAAFPLRNITGLEGGTAPVQEVAIPIRLNTAPEAPIIGIVRYHLDGRQLEGDLHALDNQIAAQTRTSLFAGLGAVLIITLAAMAGLRKAHKQLQERNKLLVRTEVELTLAAKASAMGQVTSHLMHALKGAVSGLRAASAPGQAPDLEGIAEYTAKVDAMIRETTEILADLGSNNQYHLPSSEILRSIELRQAAVAEKREVRLLMEDHLGADLDNHRASIVCLIANNLIQNAVEASGPNSEVRVVLKPRKQDGMVLVEVRDQGPGIDPLLRERLFQPGVSARAGGTGLGLAISRLLARQISGDLRLLYSSASGSCFELSFPNPEG